MNVLFVGFMSLAAALTVNEQVAPYCKKGCKIGREFYVHTVCHFKCQISKVCTRYQGHPLNVSERQQMLDYHNEARNRVAAGKDTRGFNGAATNMMVLNYDLGEEIPALCWAKRCKGGHDKCRTANYPQGSGQNVWRVFDRAPPGNTNPVYLSRAMYSWYDEIRSTTKEILLHFRQPKGATIGHYTQMLWSSSCVMGCARVSYITMKRGEPKYTILVICHYGPKGNWYSLPVYEFGPPASNCPKGTKPNSKYPALCGELKPVPSDPPQSFPIGDPWATVKASCIMLRPNLSYLTTLLLFILTIIYFRN